MLTAYVMQPLEVKLGYHGGPCTVKLELGHNEIGDTDAPELQLALGPTTSFGVSPQRG